MNRPPRSGFTIIELLAVVALIAIVIAFAVPAMTGIIKGSQMSQGSQQLNDTLLYARQLALTKNRPIEVRFYRYGDPDTPGERYDNPAAGKWHALQLFEILENGAALPAREMTRLPKGVIMQEDQYSTLLKEQLRPHIDMKNDLTAPELPLEANGVKVGRNYWVTSFRYLPDGSTDLPPTASATGAPSSGSSTASSDRWYVTLIGLTDENKNIQEINFFTLQIDSVSGTLKSFRPNVR